MGIGVGVGGLIGIDPRRKSRFLHSCFPSRNGGCSTTVYLLRQKLSARPPTGTLRCLKAQLGNGGETVKRIGTLSWGFLCEAGVLDAMNRTRMRARALPRFKLVSAFPEVPNPTVIHFLSDASLGHCS